MKPFPQRHFAAGAPINKFDAVPWASIDPRHLKEHRVISALQALGASGEVGAPLRSLSTKCLPGIRIPQLYKCRSLWNVLDKCDLALGGMAEMSAPIFSILRIYAKSSKCIVAIKAVEP